MTMRRNVMSLVRHCTCVVCSESLARTNQRDKRTKNIHSVVPLLDRVRSDRHHDQLWRNHNKMEHALTILRGVSTNRLSSTSASWSSHEQMAFTIRVIINLRICSQLIKSKKTTCFSFVVKCFMLHICLRMLMRCVRILEMYQYEKYIFGSGEHSENSLYEICKL